MNNFNKIISIIDDKVAVIGTLTLFDAFWGMPSSHGNPKYISVNHVFLSIDDCGLG